MSGDDLQRSRDKAADLSLLLLAHSLHAGDRKRADLARAGLKLAGYPGGENAPSVNEAMAAINEENGRG